MTTVLLPTDFSENSQNAIDYAIRFFKDIPCEFHLLHVVRLSDVVFNDSPYIPSEDVVEIVHTKAAKAQMVSTLRHIAQKFPKTPNHKFHTDVEYNVFINAISIYIQEKNIDFVVMGTAGASGLKRFVLGSNTAAVLSKIKCNTLVIPENAKFSEIKEMAFPTDFLVNTNKTVLEPILTIRKHFNAELSIVHIGKTKADLTTAQRLNKDSLESDLKDHLHSYYFLTNKNIPETIQCFVESRKIDMLVMLAKNESYLKTLFSPSKVKEVSYQTHIPFLVVHL